MAEFDYKGRSSAGVLVDGRLHGHSSDAIATRLLGIGITPVEITAVAVNHSTTIADIRRRMGRDQPTSKDLVLFCRQMYTITRTGLPLLRGLSGLMETTHNQVLKEALVDVIESLQAGRGLATSLQRHPKIFSELFVSMVNIGESTGTLDASFQRLYEYLGKDQEIRDRVRAATRYPLIVMVGIAAALIVITMFVIPNFAPIFRALGDNIPMPTRIIMGLSNFMINHWSLLLLAGVTFTLSAKAYVRTEDGCYQWDRIKLRIPITGRIVSNAVLARMTRSLSISLDAGLPMNETLATISGAIGNTFMAKKMGRLRAGIERGESLWQAAHSTGLFTPLVLQMIALGEETGALPDLMNESADHYWRELDYDLENLSAAIEPVLIVIVGAMVLMLALGVFLPMWDMIAATRAT